MLIAVKSCEAHWARCKAIRHTWGDVGRWIHYFFGYELGVGDRYEDLPSKTVAICRWAILHDHNPIFLCDTDTYVFVPRLYQVPYSGYRGYQLEGKGYASGGAGYLLYGDSLEIIAEAKANEFQNEDEMVGTVLAQNGVPLIHDPRFSLYQDVLPDNDIISRHLSSRGPFNIEMMYEAHRKAMG